MSSNALGRELEMFVAYGSSKICSGYVVSFHWRVWSCRDPSKHSIPDTVSDCARRFVTADEPLGLFVLLFSFLSWRGLECASFGLRRLPDGSCFGV